jgi:hypothetical protein
MGAMAKMTIRVMDGRKVEYVGRFIMSKELLIAMRDSLDYVIEHGGGCEHVLRLKARRK